MHHLSPSLIGAYFFHDCERFLYWQSLSAAALRQRGLPARPQQQAVILTALKKRGTAWETEVIGKILGAKVRIAAGTGPLHQRRHSVEETAQILAEMQPGEYLYQGCLQASPRLLSALGLDPACVHFPESYPDLIEKTADGHLRIIDLKSSEHVRLIHRLQVGMYALLLEDLVTNQAIQTPVDLHEGGIWLGQHPDYTRFDLKALLPQLRHFLSRDLPHILAQPGDQVRWHLWFRCEWCPWFQICREESQRDNSLSQLPYFQPEHRRYLETLPIPVKNLRDLHHRLLAEGETLLSGSARLMGRHRALHLQTRALLENKVFAHGGSSLLLPKGEHVTVILVLEREPVSRQVYALALHLQCKQEYRALLGLERQSPEVWLASGPDQGDDMVAEFVLRLYQIFTRLDQYHRLESAEPLRLQTYVYEEYELTNLTELLLQALQNPRPEVSQAASCLMFYFHSAQLLYQQEHAENYQSWPVIPLIRSVRQLLALPVPCSWQLAEVLKALLPPDHWFYPQTTYLLHYPLSNYLDPAALYGYWYEGHMNQRHVLVSALRNRALGLSVLLQVLRHHEQIQPQLFLWPPPFRLPGAADFQDPILSRLFFMTWNETLIGALASRQQRALPDPERQLSGKVIPLRCLHGWTFSVEHPHILLEDQEYPNLLLWPCSLEGEKAQLQFDDLRWALEYAFKIGDAPLRTLVSMQVHADPITGAARTITLTPLHQKRFLQGKSPEPGSRWMIAPRFADTNARVIHAALKQLAFTHSRFGRLLEKVCHTVRPLSLPHPLPPLEWALTDSQQAALEALCRQDLTLVWGPPGTGKTHFIATAIVHLSKAFLQTGQRFRAFIHANSHAAINNVLTKLLLLGAGDSLELFKVGSPVDNALIRFIKSKEFSQVYGTLQAGVMGATVWAYRHLKPETHTPPELIVIDEASQMTVPQGAIIWQMVGPETRVLMVGDHFQLPPILQGQYPEPDDKQPLLHRSLFEAFQHSEHLAREVQPELPQVVWPLLESYRMNEVLTRFSAQELYTMHDSQGRGYRCATPDIAQRRLQWQPLPQTPERVRYILDPDFPLVLCVLEGVQALRHNWYEAQLVAELAVWLRQGLLSPLPHTAEADYRFWHEKLFIVSPHHAQILTLRNVLHQAYPWLSPPFVDTVDKMQGQEAEAVIVSYGVSDLEAALSEMEFIYSLQRLNVSITRAQTKSVLFISRPLLRGSPVILNHEEASRGWAYMQRLEAFCEAGHTFTLSPGVQLKVSRRGFTQ